MSYGPIRRLCMTGYAHMQCLSNVVSRICHSTRRHFKRYVDMLIVIVEQSRHKYVCLCNSHHYLDKPQRKDRRQTPACPFPPQTSSWVMQTSTSGSLGCLTADQSLPGSGTMCGLLLQTKY